jgi:stress response protein SCP2
MAPDPVEHHAGREVWASDARSFVILIVQGRSPVIAGSPRHRREDAHARYGKGAADAHIDDYRSSLMINKRGTGMQTTSLRKGENLSLLTARVVLSVSVQGVSADMSALLLGPDGKVRGDHDLVFYNHPAQDGVSVEGAAITAGLSRLPANVHRVVAVVSADPLQPGAVFTRAPQLTMTQSQQVSSMKRANYLPAYLALLDDFRSAKFHQHHRYVIDRLGADHDPNLGISGLPMEAQEAVYDVAFFLHNFVVLMRLGIIDDSYLRTLNNRVVRTWEAIGPFVQRERELAPIPHLLQILEDYAAVAAVVPPGSGPSLLRHQTGDTTARP